MLHKFIKLLIFLLILPFFGFAYDSFPDFPMAFWGSTTLNGEPLIAGTDIKAFCNSQLIGEITIAEDGIYGYIGTTQNKLLLSSCDKNILFKYSPAGIQENLTGGFNVEYTEEFISGTTINKDLNFLTIQYCDIPNGHGSQNWNGNKWEDCVVKSCNSGYHQESISCIADAPASGGGGGGGNTYVPPTSNLDKVKSDMNADGKVDKYDFALMMSAWGKTGSNDCDLNGDSKVDKYDLALLMASWETE